MILCSIKKNIAGPIFMPILHPHYCSPAAGVQKIKPPSRSFKNGVIKVFFITEWFGLEGSSKGHLIQPFFHWLPHEAVKTTDMMTLASVGTSWAGLEVFRAWSEVFKAGRSTQAADDIFSSGSGAAHLVMQLAAGHGCRNAFLFSSCRSAASEHIHLHQ